MSKINFKKMSTENLKTYLVNSEVVKTVTALYSKELKSLKEDRKALIEEGKVIESASLHSTKINLIDGRIQATKDYKDKVQNALKNLVSENFYNSYKTIVSATDETQDTLDKAWTLAVADFLESIGCSGINENTATKFVNMTAFKWSGLTNGKVKSYKNFAICIASDLSTLAISKNLINMDEVNAEIKEELKSLNIA